MLKKQTKPIKKKTAIKTFRRKLTKCDDKKGKKS